MSKDRRSSWLMLGKSLSAVEDIVSVLSNNVPVGDLLIKDRSLVGTTCRLICDALLTNTNLHTLSFEKSFEPLAVAPSVFRGAFDKSSPLRSFYCSTPATHWEFDAFLEMIQALRTNSTLEELLCCTIDIYEATITLPSDLYPWVRHAYDLLRYHNFTLRRMDAFDQDPLIAKLLQQNVDVRDAHAALQKSRYQVPRLAAWPIAMGRISSKPALLYKFVRLGNCDGLARHVVRKRLPPKVTTQRKRDASASLAPSCESLSELSSCRARSRRSARRKPSA